MKILPLLFVLVLFFSMNSFAQSKDSKGCGKEKECVTKSCEETEAGAEVSMEQDHHTQKEVVVQQDKSKPKGHQVTNTKAKTKVVTKKKD